MNYLIILFHFLGNTVRLLGSKKVEGKKVGGASLELPKIRRNPLIEIIAISTGCLNQCTYCKTKHARGELGSYPPGKRFKTRNELLTHGFCFRNHSPKIGISQVF